MDREHCEFPFKLLLINKSREHREFPFNLLLINKGREHCEFPFNLLLINKSREHREFISKWCKITSKNSRHFMYNAVSKNS